MRLGWRGGGWRMEECGSSVDGWRDGRLAVCSPFSRRLLAFFSPFSRRFFRRFLCRFSPFSFHIPAVFSPYSCHVLAVFSPFGQRIDPFSPQPRSATLFRVALSKLPFPLAPPSPVEGIRVCSESFFSSSIRVLSSSIQAAFLLLGGFCALHHSAPLSEKTQLCKMAISENGPKRVIFGIGLFVFVRLYACENGHFRNRSSVRAPIRAGPFSEWAGLLSESLPPACLGCSPPACAQAGIQMRPAKARRCVQPLCTTKAAIMDD